MPKQRQRHSVAAILAVATYLVVSGSAWANDESSIGGERVDLHGDPLPVGAVARLGTTRFRLGGEFAVYSPDGRYLATSCRQEHRRNIIRLLDAVTGKELRRLIGHESAVTRVVFSPDSRLLASAARDKTIRLWDVDRGTEERRLPLERTGGGLAFSPMSDLLASAADDRTVCLWNPSNGKEVRRRLMQPIKSIGSMSFSPDGSTLVAGGDRAICFWDLATGREVRRLPFPRFVSSIAVSPDGKLVAAYSQGVTLWNVADGRATELMEEASNVRCVAFSQDGKLLAGGGCLWETESRRLIRKLPNRAPFSTIRSLCFSPDGRVVAGGDGQIWDVETGKDLRDTRGLHRTGSRVAFSPDGKHLLAGGAGKPISVWNPETGERIRQLTESCFESKRLLVTPDGKTVIADHQGQPQLHDFATGRLRHRLIIESLSVEDHDYQDVSAVDMTADGKLVLCGYRGSNTIRYWDTSTGRQTRELVVGPARRPDGPEPHVEVRQQAVSPDGRWLAVSCRNRRPQYASTYSVIVFDRATGNRLYTAPLRKPVDLTFSPDSRLLACELGCWEASTGRSIHLVFGGPPWSGLIAFSPDGQWLACGGEENRFRIIDMATFETVRDIDAHEDDVECFAFSPDGTKLATGSRDGTALVWEVKTLIGQQRPAAAAHLDGLWEDLLAENAARAHYAIWALAATPKQSVPFLSARLGGIGRGNELAHTRRKLRGITALEYIGNTEARRLLKKLADDESGTIERDAAESALKRLRNGAPRGE